MGRQRKLLLRILGGRADANIPFARLVLLLESMGFRHRQEGSHPVFSKDGIVELLNLQEDGAKAKRYQVRQVRKVIFKYGLDEHV